MCRCWHLVPVHGLESAVRDVGYSLDLSLYVEAAALCLEEANPTVTPVVLKRQVGGSAGDMYFLGTMPDVVMRQPTWTRTFLTLIPPISVPACPLSKMPRQYDPVASLKRYCMGLMRIRTEGSNTNSTWGGRCAGQ